MPRAAVLLTIVLSGLAFVLLAVAVGAGGTQGFDERVLLALRDVADRGVPAGPPWLAEVGRDLSALGSEVALTLLLLSVAGYLLLSGGGRAVPPLFVAALGGFALSEGLKTLIARPRPVVVPHLSWTWSSSFPSGHAMLSTTVYLTLAVFLSGTVREPRLRILFVALAAGLALLVGCSRVFLGVHYPTDVIGGFLAGLGWSLLVAHLFRRRLGLVA
ncbi:MAG: phosphatase PAP2 family protein [Planctomycetes bacterium]|jgi:undecaprenyl-diphosphatase|nr:phosphatase PAP2 family protein [Planctomycetota bacterium]